MSVSSATNTRLTLPSAIGWPVAIAGLLAVFATYWDEAWHTDVGRDSAWAAPHVLLYGSVAVVGLGVAVWGFRVLAETRSLRASLGQSPLLAAGLGALGVLVAAPIDAFWHEASGRDAVLWSPPHMLVVLASTALVLGVLAGLPGRARSLRAMAGVLMLANAVAVVFEFEADVPQFSEVLYLPLLLIVGLAAVWVLRDVVPLRVPVVAVVLGYAGLRLAIAGGLLAMGRSAPDLPIAVLGLAAFDLPLRRTSSRVAAAAVATAGLAWGASASSLASPVSSAVAVTAVPVIVLGILSLLLRSRNAVLVAAAVLLGAGAILTISPEQAEAHDPGQGEPIARLQLTATADGAGRVALTATADEHCEDLTPSAVVARRAGQTITAELQEDGRCRFQGELRLLSAGRWFLYAEFTHAGTPAEAWLPVQGRSAGIVERSRILYRPAGDDRDASGAQILFGVLIYAAGLGLLAVGVRAARSRRQPYLVSPEVCRC